MQEEDPLAEFPQTTLPSTLKEFLFFLHHAVRRSKRLDEVQLYYESKQKEVSDQYFSQTPWPDAKSVAAEVGHDETFLLFYRELAVRHSSTKLPAKQTIQDHINSWENYLKLFDFVMNAREDDYVITTQWIYDILAEFAYQFQGFCQYRSQVTNLNHDACERLDANKQVWNLAVVHSYLTKLISAAKTKYGNISFSNLNSNSSCLVQFAYFARIELARIECLIGDYNASLAIISSTQLFDRSQLFTQIVICQFGVFYHAGVSNMMLRRFQEATDIFCEIILLLSRVLKPGASSLRSGTLIVQLQRNLDKVLHLIAIAITLCPGNKVDDQVRELVELKLSEKFRRLQSGDQQIFKDFFESGSPKFIYPAVPDYTVSVNWNAEAYNHQENRFMTEVQQHLVFLKLRSFMNLYASIDTAKLARFNDISENDLICSLISCKNKYTLSRAGGKGSARYSINDVHFFIDNGVIIIDSATTKHDGNKLYERHFTASVKKHAEIVKQINNAFSSADL